MRICSKAEDMIWEYFHKMEVAKLMYERDQDKDKDMSFDDYVIYEYSPLFDEFLTEYQYNTGSVICCGLLIEDETILERLKDKFIENLRSDDDDEIKDESTVITTDKGGTNGRSLCRIMVLTLILTGGVLICSSIAKGIHTYSNKSKRKS